MRWSRRVSGQRGRGWSLSAWRQGASHGGASDVAEEEKGSRERGSAWVRSEGGGVSKGMRRSSNSQERGGVRVQGRGRRRPTFIGQNGGARDMRKTTMRGDGAAPDSVGRRVGVTGERISQGVVGRLGEEATSWRLPVVRQFAKHQSTDTRGRYA
jgi:hypothetical protein